MDEGKSQSQQIAEVKATLEQSYLAGLLDDIANKNTLVDAMSVVTETRLMSEHAYTLLKRVMTEDQHRLLSIYNTAQQMNGHTRVADLKSLLRWLKANRAGNSVTGKTRETQASGSINHMHEERARQVAQGGQYKTPTSAQNNKRVTWGAQTMSNEVQKRLK